MIMGLMSFFSESLRQTLRCCSVFLSNALPDKNKNPTGNLRSTPGATLLPVANAGKLGYSSYPELKSSILLSTINQEDIFYEELLPTDDYDVQLVEASKLGKDAALLLNKI